MPEETGAAAAHQRLVVKIVGSYVSKNVVAATELPALIASVHHSMLLLGRSAPPAPEIKTPAVPVRRSVQHDHVTCLDCGWRGQMLRRHLAAAHALTPERYRERWNLSSTHPLTAPNYTSRRSSLAKRFGLGRSRAAATERT